MTRTNSRLFEYVQQVYETLEEQAETNEHQERLFVGNLTEVILGTGASKSWYSKIRSLLDSPLEDPCIVVRQRGAGSQPSIVEVRHPPPDGWQDLTKPEGAARLQGMKHDVTVLRAWMESMGGMNIVETLRNHEDRISRLEKENGRTEV